MLNQYYLRKILTV